MLTDAEARDLLHAAADTIDVDPVQPLPVVHHRPLIWPMLVAAAAVVAVVATTLALADRGSSPLPGSPPPPTPAVDRIPPVMGLDVLDAVARLEDVGLVVRTRSRPGCVEQPLAAGTSPPVGSRFSGGDQIELTVLNDSADSCDGSLSLGWGLLRFALGISPSPRLAETLTLYPGNGEPVTLTADEAQDHANWEVCNGDLCGSALSILAAAATRPGPTDTAAPTLEVWEQTSSLERADPCVNGTDIGGSGTHYGISIAPPTDGITICPQVTVQYSGNGLLEAVAIPLFPEEADAPTPSTDAAGAADAFVAWARGSGQPPAFAEEVRYLINDAVVRTMAGENASRRGRWKVCYSGLPLGCPSPFKTLKYYDGQMVRSTTAAMSCVARTGRLPSDLTAFELVRLDQPGATSCRDAFAVELWVDSGGRITAINLLPGSEAGPAY